MRRASPGDWWRIRPLDDGVTLIDEPMVHPDYRCNVWHVRGRSGDLLIDSGIGVVPLRRHVARLCERPVEAVASHTHFDHIGGHHEFSCRSCHAAEADILRNPTPSATWADRYLAAGIFTRLPPNFQDPADHRIAPAPATRLLWDGDRIDLGDRSFDVIHTPGHSPGGIALWEAATGILFSGDVVYDGELIEGTSPLEQWQYHRSMVRLFDLPVRIVHAGHYHSYDGARHRAIIRDWLDRKERA